MTACKAKRKEADKQDDCTQIDCIIGPYGKYQFMIFLFKILIGLVWQFPSPGPIASVVVVGPSWSS